MGKLQPHGLLPTTCMDLNRHFCPFRYDANTKNFYGCSGGFAVYGSAIKVSDSKYAPPEDLSDYGCTSERRLSQFSTQDGTERLVSRTKDEPGN